MKESSTIGVMRRLPKGWMEWSKDELEEHYFKTLDNPKLSSISKRHIYYSIKHLLDFKGTPWNYKPPKYHQRRRQSIDPDTVYELLDFVTDKRSFAMILLSIYSGLRPGELVNLQRKNVDFERMQITVKDTKTYKDRIVPLHKRPAAALKRYLVSRRDNHPALFYSRINKGEMTTTGYRSLLKRLCKRAGLEDITPYQFRHLFGTTFMENGGDIMILSKILGHSSITITVSTYVHCNPRMIKQGYDRACPEF